MQVVLIGGPYDGATLEDGGVLIDATGRIFLPPPVEKLSDAAIRTDAPYLVVYGPTDRIGRYAHEGYEIP